MGTLASFKGGGAKRRTTCDFKAVSYVTEAKRRSDMSTLSKLALGAMGRLRPKPALGLAEKVINLGTAEKQGGMPLMEALSKRKSVREFAPTVLDMPMLSNLLWAACGVNREDGGRTAPSALNAQEIDMYVALPSGAYLYDAAAHALRLVAASDLRRVTGYQDFVDEAPVDLVFVADHRRMALVPVTQRAAYAAVAAGAISQNVYLFAASNGLATVLRAWIDRGAIADALGLDHDREVLLSQTVGYPADSVRAES
jgi:SagB-type dehydrogenase family enzyme